MSKSDRSSSDRSSNVEARQPELIAAATVARSSAHAPYSRFAVGAAVLDEHGHIHAGCNVENAAYPQGWCAEASALAAMVLAGGQRALAVAVCAVAPQPVTHAATQRALAGVLHRPLWLRVPAFVLRTALGEMSELLLDGQRVVPARALAAGFEFRHPEIRAALSDLLATV